jgi:hypothetical protein
MTNPLVNWWRSHRLHRAIVRGNTPLAKQLLHQLETSQANLSLSAQLFKKTLTAERTSRHYRQQIHKLQRQLQSVEHQQFLDVFEHPGFVPPDATFIHSISQKFKIVECDAAKLQCTGIYEEIFYDFEYHLSEFIQQELEAIPPDKLPIYLSEALEDIEGLKRGIDPQYRFKLTPHVYFMKYFAENVYCTYLAWFLIYQSGLLPKTINILDIAAGPGTVAYGLALFLQSSQGVLPNPEAFHVSYYSLEQLNNFQYRGLQFWRRYLETQARAVNAYFRFDTGDLFEFDDKLSKIPPSFFDFIIISHCIFANPEKRAIAYQVYREIFEKSLKAGGYVLLIVQGTKLFKVNNQVQTEDIHQEKTIITDFLEELGLKLEWYKYVTSTGKRTYIPNYGDYAKKYLPVKKYISPLMQKYLGVPFESNYSLDDYIILGKRS